MFHYLSMNIDMPNMTCNVILALLLYNIYIYIYIPYNGRALFSNINQKGIIVEYQECLQLDLEMIFLTTFIHSFCCFARKSLEPLPRFWVLCGALNKLIV